MSLAQVQGKAAAEFVIDTRQDVGLQVEFRIIGHQARIAVDDHNPRILGAAEHNAEDAAVEAGRFDVHDAGIGRQAAGNRRQTAIFDLLRQNRRTDGLNRMPGGRRQRGCDGP